MKRQNVVALLLIVVTTAVALTATTGHAAKGKGEDAAVARTRKQVKMLDDLYKTAVVLITTHYVQEDSDLAAGEAAVALFAAMKEKGWHEVRLLDATGEPIVDANLPKDDFEKSAVKALLGGESWHEAVVDRDGKRYLRAATPIPVVLEKCTMCHDNYKNVKKGQPIGALSYTIEIE
ncbi:MAG: DUF3365 domain-containing protein [Planctomycetales bacterium]|nr:DUF3365 domain-containing protein [Planctomycetales bacterium]